MQGEGGHPTYGHHVPMDLHVPQHFPYYAGCIMDNQAMFTAQQMQYNKMYAGIDPTGRRMDELAAQGSLNSRYGQHPKEKSRDAARSRRGKENFEFYELAKMLPLPGAITSQLDKASIVRLTIAYLRLREFAAHGDPPWNRDGRFDGKATLKGSTLRRVHGPNLGGGLAMDIFEEHEGTHILQSLDGFAISLASDGRFLYISETVSIYLGLSQVELTGSSFFDYIHQSDHDELAEQLGVSLANPMGGPDSPPGPEGDEGAGTLGPAPPIPDVCYPVTTLMSNTRQDKNGKPNYDRAFCIRMKSTLTKRGCHFKSSGYRVVLMLGKLRPQYSYSSAPSGGVPGKKHSPPIMGFIGLAVALPPPSVHEVRLEADMFVTRLAFDFKIAHCEPKVSELLDYSAEDLTGKSMYALVHAGDVEKIKQTHVDLTKKGQVMSDYYRLMNRRGGYTWMQICATLVCNSKNSDEQSIICVNYVLSGAQHSHLVMDKHQVDQPAGSDIKQDNTEEPGDIRNGTPESVKGADSVDYSNQGSEGGGEQHGHGDGAYYPDQAHLRLGQTPVATPDHGLRSPGTPEEKSSSSFEKGPIVHKDTHDTETVISQGNSKRARKNTASPQVHVSSPSPPATLPQTSQSKTSGYSPPVSQSTTRYSGSTITDQNCNSVRDLENAMSKHLPKDKSPDDGAQSPTVQTTSSMSSHLLKQFYSRQAGYLSDLQSEHTDGGQAPAGGGFSLQSYARLAAGPSYAGPAAPVPLKPNTSSHLYSPAAMTGNEPTAYAGSAATFPAEAHQQAGHALYPHPGVSSFHLYNRTAGQNWYSGGN